MEGKTPKTHVAPSSFSYNYYYINPQSDSNKPTLLFLHGWPDDAHLWSAVIPQIESLNFPMLIPDLLGYGGTSKPTTTSSYSSKSMSTDLASILDSENITSVLPIGHDWGAFMAQRFYFWYPSRCVGLGLINVAYMPPDQEKPFNLQDTLIMTNSVFGYPLFAYWELFTAPDGPEVLNAHLESLWTVLHGAPEGHMKNMFGALGAMRAYLTSDKLVPLRPYAEDAKLRDTFIARFRRDGFAAPVQWYKAMAENIQFEAEKEIPSERFRIDKPVLFIACKQDAVCLPSLIKPPQELGLLPQLTVTEIDCGHWSPLEEPEKMAKQISAFLTANFAA